MVKPGLLESLPLAVMMVFLLDGLCKKSAGVCPGDDWVKFTDSDICAVTGSSVVIPCSFTPPAGQDATKVFWLINAKNGVEPSDIADNSSYTGRVKYFWNEINDKNNCTLRLSDVNMTDSAEYRARIIADTDKWQSCAPVKLSVTELTVGLPKTVVEGREVKLSCNTTCENATVIWRKNGEDLLVEQTHISDLLLQRVSTEDEGDYSCALKGHEGHPSKSVRLTVMFPPRNTTISITPNVITQGSSLNLICNSYANPPVENYTWFKVNESTPVGSGQQYSITNIRSEDGGQYYCEARNKYGAENSSAVSITVVGYRSPSYPYVIAGVSVCGAAGLLCVLVWIRYDKINRDGKTNGQDNDVQMHIKTDIQTAGQSRPAACPPSAETAEGAGDDVQYASVQSKCFRQTAGVAQDDVLYSTIQPHGTRQTAGALGDDVQYASVQFKKARARQNSPTQPEGELSVIYSSVEKNS